MTENKKGELGMYLSKGPGFSTQYKKEKKKPKKQTNKKKRKLTKNTGNFLKARKNSGKYQKAG